MPITVRYDVANRYGGTPASQSIKEFTAVAPNAAIMASVVRAESDDSVWATPCLQNFTNGFVTVTGDWDYYDAVVQVTGFAYETAGTAGTGSVTGGLTWTYSDSAGAQRASNNTKPNAPPQPMRITPVAFSYPIRLRNGRRRLLCRAGSAGGMQLRPVPGPFSSFTWQVLILSFSIHFTAGWQDLGLDVPVLDIFEAPPAVNVAPGASTSEPTEPQHWWDLFGRFVPRQKLRRAPDDAFSAPALRETLGAAAGVLEEKRIARMIDDTIERWKEELGLS